MNSDAAPTVELTDGTDLPAIHDLLEAAGLPPEGLNEPHRSLFVARSGDSVVGCVALEHYPSAVFLRSLTVDPAWRGRGLGTLLTQAALDRAAGTGARRVYLLTETAEHFFWRFGFQRTERDHVDATVRTSPEFTSLCPDTAIAMELELASGG